LNRESMQRLLDDLFATRSPIERRSGSWTGS